MSTPVDTNANLPSFGPVARHYDLLMAGVPYRMWAEYLKLLHAHQGIHPGTILDVCCGTGTVAMMLAREGYQVTGFDLSPPMIEIARRKAEEKELPIQFEVADATLFEFGTTYDAAFSFFDSLNYITTLDGFRAAVTQVGKHLRPGGSFVFDLNTAYAFEARLFDQQETRAKAAIRYNWVGDYDRHSRIIRVRMEFWRGEEKFHEVHTQRAHSDEEVRQALADAGFGEVQAFHSYTLERPRKKSDRVHYTALRNG